MATVLLESDILDVRLTENGDLYVGPNGLEFVSGLEGVGQLVVIAIRMFLGEWFLNLDKGMPWFQEILGQKDAEDTLRRRLAETALGVPGVTAIISLTVELDGSTRRASGSMVVRTVFGDTPPDLIKFSIGGSSNG